MVKLYLRLDELQDQNKWGKLEPLGSQKVGTYARASLMIKAIHQRINDQYPSRIEGCAE